MPNFSFLKKICAGLLPVSLFLAPTFIATAQRSGRIPSEKPALIIGLVLDQMRPDQIYRYWDKFGDDGFRKLVDNGTVMRQAGFHYNNTQPAPGCATIATGAQPSVHGIVSDSWYEMLKDGLIHCTDDKSVKPVGGAFEQGQYSPHNILVSSLGDEIKLAGKDNKVFSIGWSNECAIISGGHSANGAFWIDSRSGRWMTSSYYCEMLPGWLNKFNEKGFPDIYLERIWEPLLPLEEYTGYAVNKSISLPVDLERESRIDRNTRNYSMLRDTPYGNTMVLNMAMNLIYEEQMGKDEHVDYLIINLPAIGAVAKKYGRESVELEDAFLRLDQDIALLLSSLDEWVGKNRMLIYLTATHGMNQDIKYLKNAKMPAGEFDGNQALSLLRAYLNARFGRGNWVKSYYENQVFLNRSLIEDSRLSIDDIRNEVANFMIQFEAVAHAISATTITSSYFPGGINSLLQNGYNAKRSGDVMIVLRSGWSMKGQHREGTGYNYGRKVPLIWYGWKVRRKTIHREVDMSDIAPTISYFLDISVPDASTGKPILDMLE